MSVTERRGDTQTVARTGSNPPHTIPPCLRKLCTERYRLSFTSCGIDRAPVGRIRLAGRQVDSIGVRALRMAYRLKTEIPLPAMLSKDPGNGGYGLNRVCRPIHSLTCTL